MYLISSNKILLISLLAMLASSELCDANGIEILLPQCANISVNDIYLRDSESAQEVLGGDIKLSTDKDLPYIRMFNKDKSQMLVLTFHPGDIKNSFSEILIKKSDLKNEDIRPLETVDYYITGKNVRLGLSKNELISILGNNHTSSSEGEILIIRYRIAGIESSEFLRSYNMPVYYGEYRFRDNRLFEFSFGYEYP
jgi:hypothetical protein